MREIKFRAFDNKNKKWLLGYEYPNLGGFSLFGEAILFGEWGNTFDKFLFEREGLTWNDLIVEQFTGLKDKNGKEIYEGDIVKGFHKEQKDKDGKRGYYVQDAIKFQNGSFKWNGKPLSDGYTRDNNILNQFMWWEQGNHSNTDGWYYQIDEIEVIGNIHEPTPQLTK